jgi:hypothetical protein
MNGDPLLLDRGGAEGRVEHRVVTYSGCRHGTPSFTLEQGSAMASKKGEHRTWCALSTAQAILDQGCFPPRKRRVGDKVRKHVPQAGQRATDWDVMQKTKQAGNFETPSHLLPEASEELG